MKPIYSFLLSAFLLCTIHVNAQITISGAAPAIFDGTTYTTFTGTGGAFAALNGVAAWAGKTIVLTVTDNITTEDGNNSLNQPATSTWTSLTIRPSVASQRTIRGNVTNGMIRFNGADNVTIDGRFGGTGKYLRFLNSNTSNPTFTFLNDATNNTIDYSITESGRSALLLINHITPMKSNNYGNFYVTVSNIVSSKQLTQDKLVSIGIDNTSLFGIRDEFFVGEKALMGMSTGMFMSDINYNSGVLNSINLLKEAKAIGYLSNVTISNTESLEFEICQQLFNTFDDDSLNIIGGLVAIKTYNSKEAIYVNSLIYKLINKTYGNVTPYVSSSDSSYIVFKDDSGNTVGVIKSKKYICQKEFIGTQDLQLLISKINKNYNSNVVQGLNISENQPNVIGIGFIEKSELTSEDFQKIMSVPFKELRSILGNLNRDNYFNELDLNEAIARVIVARKGDYDKFESDVKEEMGKKLKALEVINEYYTGVGNEEKKTYYFDLIEAFKNKIDNFRL